MNEGILFPHIRLGGAYHSSYTSDVSFSIGHMRSYEFDYDSYPVAYEHQGLKAFSLEKKLACIKCWITFAISFLVASVSDTAFS